MRIFGFIVSFSIVLLSSAWAEDASVHAFHDSFFKAWNTADADGLVARLAEDTVYHPMGGETMRGRQTVGDSYRGFLKSFDVRMEVTPELLESSGNQGLMMGLYTSVLTPKDGRASWTRSGRYYMDLVRDDNGDWQISRELTQTTADPIAGVQTAPDALATAGEMRRRFAEDVMGMGDSSP